MLKITTPNEYDDVVNEIKTTLREEIEFGFKDAEFDDGKIEMVTNYYPDNIRRYVQDVYENAGWLRVSVNNFDNGKRLRWEFHF